MIWRKPYVPYRHATFRTPGRAAVTALELFPGLLASTVEPVCETDGLAPSMLTPLSIAISLPYALVRPSGSRLIMTCSCYRWKQPLVERNCREVAGFMHRRREIAAIYSRTPGMSQVLSCSLGLMERHLYHLCGATAASRTASAC